MSDGITLDFLIYCGHGMFNGDDENEEMPVTERIPVALMQPYLDSGRITIPFSVEQSKQTEYFTVQSLLMFKWKKARLISMSAPTILEW